MLGAAFVASPRAQAADKIYSPIAEQGQVALELRAIRQFDADDAIDGTEKLKFVFEYAHSLESGGNDKTELGALRQLCL